MPPPRVVPPDNVSRLVINGASNKETARALDISPSSVATHVASIF
ncbi:LuxR C-terminal-related transcriptional regulator [Halomonas campaniensis]